MYVLVPCSVIANFVIIIILAVIFNSGGVRKTKSDDSIAKSLAADDQRQRKSSQSSTHPASPTKSSNKSRYMYLTLMLSPYREKDFIGVSVLLFHE